MKTRTILPFSIICLFAHYFLSTTGFAQPIEIGRVDAAVTQVPLVSLLVKPETYDGKKIRVIGVFSRDSVDGYLFLSQDHCDAFDVASAIRVPLYMEDGKTIPFHFVKKFVSIEGEFVVDKKLSIGCMKYISRIMIRENKQG